MDSRQRIRQVIEKWFLMEPLLFSIWTSHRLLMNPRIGTIRVRNGIIEYNTEFIAGLNEKLLAAVLQFETLRILLQHPYSRRKENHELAYIASNVTIQEYAHTELPFPNAKELFANDDFNLQYFEFYYYKLQEITDKKSSIIINQGTSISGSLSETTNNEAKWSDNALILTTSKDLTTANDSDKLFLQMNLSGESNPNDSSIKAYTDAAITGVENTQDWDSNELLENRINDKIQNAMESNSWGTIGGHLRERILVSLRPRLDYRTILRQFRVSVLASNRVLTRMKPSRRYGFRYMGSRRDFTTQLLFAVDVSGSINAKDLSRGFSIVNQFFKYGIETIDVIQFDTDITGKPMTLKRASSSVDAVGRGGTDFAPVMAYIDEHRKYDGLIIFTDGCAPVPPIPKNRKTRIIWIFNNKNSYDSMNSGLSHLGRSVYLKED